MVYVWDLSTPLDVVNDSRKLAEYHKTNISQPIQPLYQFDGHHVEGFAMDWSTKVLGEQYK